MSRLRVATGVLFVAVLLGACASGASTLTPSSGQGLGATSTSVTAESATATAASTMTEGTSSSSPLPVIESSGEPKPEYAHPDWVYEHSDAVVVAQVVEMLPPRQNPLAGQPDEPDGTEHLPIFYRGYVLAIERAYGPATMPGLITAYTDGTGIYRLDGTDEPLNVDTGTRLFIALAHEARYGTPKLKENEYWEMAQWSTFVVDKNGLARRVTGQGLARAEKVANEFDLSALEDIAVAQGRSPSVVE